MDDGPTVLHVATHVSDQGGAEVSLLQTLEGLQEQGIRNVVLPLSSRWATESVRTLHDAGVRVLEPTDGGVLRNARRVRDLQRSVRPDVVHSVLWDADLAARLAHPGSGTRHVSSLVNTPYTPEAFAAAPSPRRLAVARALEGVMARRLTTRFHAISGSVADAAVAQLGVDRRRVEVVPRGRDRRLLGEPSGDRRHAVRQLLGVPLRVPLVLNVARQEPQKGLDLLLAAFAELAARHPGAVLVQAGREGAASSALRSAVTALGLDGRVRFLGRRTDVADLLTASDVFAFSSLWEGLGGAVLEAMALEVPVVAFDVPAVREVLGGHGLLARLGDPADLAARLLEALDDGPGSRARAAAARQRFDEHYALDVVVPRMAAFYRSVAG